ncbi:MAG: fimbrillin family protein [Roseburia sp.]|nr:fimbrillin family protein [Anaeroplasma bactoclasticum]MCM1196308.1 fimbrillin family protein [Roseburia sp.]MCM1557170.1 fimbrillin family protein [Anaeroplasma bactoclasticum]
MKKVFAIFIGILSLCLFASCSKEEESDALTHAEYLAIEKGSTVTIEAYIQGKQSWWESDGVGVASFYLQDQDGGYFVYNLPCTKDDYDKKLTAGTKIQVTGNKTEWAGEVEIDGLSAGAEATYKVLNAKKFIANPKDVTDQLGKDLLASQNMAVTFKNLEVVAQEDGTKAFYYKWDNSGSRGDDLYITLTDGTNTLSAVVESYLCDKDSDVYKAVEALQVGDKVTIEAFLYWYNGAQPHITKVTKSN